MSYFDGIKVGNEIWTVLNGWEKVRYINEWSLWTNYNEYDLDGFLLDEDGERISKKQVAFWDKIEFEIPQRPKIRLKNDYRKIFNDKLGCEIPLTSFNQLIRFAKLLALRDELCPDSKGYEFTESNSNYTIYESDKFKIVDQYYYEPDRVYFANKEDAEKICNILNEGRFEL